MTEQTAEEHLVRSLRDVSSQADRLTRVISRILVDKEDPRPGTARLYASEIRDTFSHMTAIPSFNKMETLAIIDAIMSQAEAVAFKCNIGKMSSVDKKLYVNYLRQVVWLLRGVHEILID